MNEADIYRQWDPPAAWRHAVVCCWEQRIGADRVQRVLPDGHADLLVHESGVIEVVGLQDTVALPVLAAGTRLRGVRLHPAAVAAAFETSASSLRNLAVDAADVLGTRRARELTQPEGLDAWIRSIRPDPRTTAALELLQTISVADCADRLGMTSRHLRRILLEDAGLTPKLFQRVWRLQRFVGATDRGAPLATAAVAAGFADQPHLTREVRDLAGVTPARLVMERRPLGLPDLAGVSDARPRDGR